MLKEQLNQLYEDLRKLAGRNSHHIVEGAFKALGRALREAAETDPRFRDEIPSTKGML